MVKCHRKSGAPRHFRGNQRKYATMKNGLPETGTCKTCLYVGHAGGINPCPWRACFNKQSKMYMHRVYGDDKCSCYKMGSS